MNYNDNVVNDYLKGCSGLRTALHREVYNTVDGEEVIKNIESSIFETYGNNIISLDVNLNNIVVKITKDENVRTDMINNTLDNILLSVIEENKNDLISFDNELENIIESVLNRSVSISNLYDILSVTENGICTVDIHL